MDETISNSGKYRIEVSGWGLNNAFFVEKTDLFWTEGEEKKLRLHHALPDGTVIFVRLISQEASFGSVPVAYQVENVQPMNSDGLCEMRLVRLHPRSKAHTRSDVAYPTMNSISKVHDPEEIPTQPEFEEVLHEA